MNARIKIAVLAAALLTVASTAWAASVDSPKTTGLTGVSVAVTGNSTIGYDYNFTLTNNSLDTYSAWDVLVGEFNVFGVATGTPPTIPQPTAWYAPTGWVWDNGAWKNDAIGFAADKQGSWYYSPPTLAPGDSLAGFKLHYDGGAGVNQFEYVTHVFAVLPEHTYDASKDAELYDPTSVFLNSSIYSSTFTGEAGTWWDKPEDFDRPTSVPEASSILLGSLGLLGPVGLAFRRKMSS